jgi:fructose-1,6-bisphosphatase/inositol monophosphatase family enzyme
MDLDLQRCLDVAVQASKAAGDLIEQGFYAQNKNVQHKGAVDLVTETDKQAEKIISEMLHSAFPDHAFIGEETAAAAGGQGTLTDTPTWMVSARQTPEWAFGAAWSALQAKLTTNDSP